MKKIISLFIVFISIFTISFAHPGRTDSNGGHYDRSTGEYHYHHGYSAHQHNADGSCPYETKLTINDTTSTDTGEYTISRSNDVDEDKKEIQRLENLVTDKEDTIGNLTDEINDYKDKIEKKESEIEGLHTMYIIIIIIMGIIIYYMHKNKK